MKLPKSLTQVIIEQQRTLKATGQFSALLNDIARACKRISHDVNRGQLVNILGSAGTINVQSETQTKLDIISNEVLIKSMQWDGHIAAMASEEMENICPVPAEYPKGPYMVLFDPLDGSTNIDVNMPIGTIFSILRLPAGVEEAQLEHFLQSGIQQVCAGYCLYGSSTMMVLSTGVGVDGFTLDPGIGEFVLTHPKLRIPSHSYDYSINAAHAAGWESAIRQYIDDCVAGEDGPFGHRFNMRWVGAMVADVHRTLMRGGVFMYPRDTRSSRAGKIRLLYEANPMGFLVEQAGGASISNTQCTLEIKPESLHQRVSVVMGSKENVETIRDYYHRHELAM